VGENVLANPQFDDTVKMWVFEEIVDGKKLTEIINETHENVKYLKGFTIPKNVVRLVGQMLPHCTTSVCSSMSSL